MTCIPRVSVAGGEVLQRVRKALDYLNGSECSIEESQKLNYLCKSVTDLDLNELVNRARKTLPCIKIADDFSSLTTSASGKSYTINMSLQGILCGSSSAFSVGPSDGCITADDAKNAEKTAKEIVGQLVDIVANSLDTRTLFDIRPTCMKAWDFPFTPDNPFKQLKRDLARAISSAPLCDNECEGGKDKNGFVTEMCCQRNKGIFTTKENRNYCCPDISGTPKNCPSSAKEPTEECVSSCRIGTEEIGGTCCTENKIATSSSGKKCCKKDMHPSIFDKKNSLSICCEQNKEAVSETECCPEKDRIFEEPDWEPICCASGKVAYAEDSYNPWTKKKCCSDSEVVAKGINYGREVCCDPKDVANNGSCCTGNKHNTNGHCCEIGKVWVEDPTNT